MTFKAGLINVLFKTNNTVPPKNSGALKNVYAQFYASSKLNFIYMVNVVIVQAFILRHINVTVLISI